MGISIPMITGIFVSYRREDALATAGRLYDQLVREFGRKQVFMDVDHIPAGVDFVEHIEQQLARCGILLAIIGRGWLTAHDASGSRRIVNPEDLVATEIAAALRRGIPVIPVLVDGASMPKPDDLPINLKPLARRNAVELRNTQFNSDSARLVSKIRESLSGSFTTWKRWPIVATADAGSCYIIVSIESVHF